MSNYNRQQLAAEEHAEKLLKGMPSFCRNYFNHKEGKILGRSRLTYIQKIRKFLEFLLYSNPSLQNKKLSEITLDDIDRLTTDDIEEFEHWIRTRKSCPNVRDKSSTVLSKSASPSTVNSYLAALNSFWDYFVKKGNLSRNPVRNVERDKEPSNRHIPHLEVGKADELIKETEEGTGMSKRAGAYHNRTAARDTAIIILFLRTGLRLSELAGIDLSDVDLKSPQAPRILTMRKGESEDYIYLDDETEKVLEIYISERINIAVYDEPALFISYYGSKKGYRMSVRSIQKLVHKYTMLIGEDTHPHALRATYATELLQKVDVSMVQKALNHSSPTTTMRYADLRTKDMRSIRNVLMNESINNNQT